MLLIFFREISSNYLGNSAAHMSCVEFLRRPLRALRIKQTNKRTPIPIRTAYSTCSRVCLAVFLKYLSVVTTCATCLRLRSQSFVAAVILAENRETALAKSSSAHVAQAQATQAEYDMHRCGSRIDRCP
ncbi:hypothetical protein [Bradyrhizobium sp. CCBAU 53421]|uniref:hypothetical protein n=1 Tax=Bradyrhizobium sp. CCBAU 53421 TaxID=1325120 RepID=UPI00188A79C2|nr:hypothetical protein [Bradyrhizobium sp. CCBAU 53421]